jgi:hypothetical protein
MNNKYIAIRWLKDLAVKNQRYELATICRDWEVKEIQKIKSEDIIPSNKDIYITDLNIEQLNISKKLLDSLKGKSIDGLDFIENNVNNVLKRIRSEKINSLFE